MLKAMKENTKDMHAMHSAWRIREDPNRSSVTEAGQTFR
jgi:hypothetical protein